MRLCQRPETIVTFSPGAIGVERWAALRRSSRVAPLRLERVVDAGIQHLVGGERVTHPVALGVEVALVELADADDERHQLGDGRRRAPRSCRAFSGLLVSRRTLEMPRSLRMPVAAP